MRQLIFLFFLFPLIAVGQQSPTQILNTPWQKINYKLEVGQRLLLPADTLSYPPGATVRDTTRLLAFAPNGNLYKLWNGVWSLIGAGGGTDVQLLGDSAIVVGDDTIRVKPITFESDMPPAYFFKDGDTIRDYTLQYLNDSVKVRKSGDTLFFPNGDSIYAAGIDRTGFLTADSQYIDGPKIFTENLQVGSWALGNRDIKIHMYPNLFSPGEGNSNYAFIRGRDLGNNSGQLFINGHGGSNGFGALGSANVNLPILTWSNYGVRIKSAATFFTDSANLIIEGDKAVRIPVGTTGQRPNRLLSGYMRVNTDSSGIEWYNGSAWRVLGSGGGGGSGTVTSITAGLRLTGGTITTSGTIDVDTAALSGAYIKNQIAAKESKNSWYQKARLDSLLSGFVTVQHNNANGGVVVLRDKGAGVPPSLGDNIGQFAAGGYVGDTVNLGRRGGMRILANQNWSNTANGSTVLFDVTTNDSLTARVRARLWGQGFGVSAYGTSLGSTALTPPATLFVEKSLGNTNNTKAFALQDSTATERFHVTDSGRIQGDAYAGTSQAQVLAGTDGTLTRGFVNTDDVVKVFQALGSEMKAQTVGMSVTNATASLTMPDARAYFTAVWLSDARTITGVGWIQQTAGSYTADATNQIGLYTFSGGTLTLVASSTNDGDLWKASSNTIGKKAFSSTYSAQPGLYFIGMVYNSSAETTAPVIRRVTNAAPHPSFFNFDFTNSAKISGLLDAQSSLPSSVAMSSITTNSNMPYVFIY